MSRRPPANLPDLDDEVFRAKMQPLVEQALPDSRKSIQPDNRISAEQDIRISTHSGQRISERPETRKDGPPANHSPGHVVAAQKIELIEQKRGAKRRYEYLIPERVGNALAADAARRGISATMRLLEILRDAGYPVILEDLVDLRKLPKR